MPSSVKTLAAAVLAAPVTLAMACCSCFLVEQTVTCSAGLQEQSVDEQHAHDAQEDCNA
jgi:hypothetical protein